MRASQMTNSTKHDVLNARIHDVVDLEQYVWEVHVPLRKNQIEVAQIDF